MKLFLCVRNFFGKECQFVFGKECQFVDDKENPNKQQTHHSFRDHVVGRTKSSIPK